MKRLLISLVLIVLAGTAVVGATSSYFTDKVEVSGNTFTAGRVDIKLNGAGANPQTFTNMAPGVWTSQVLYEVYNQANSLPVKYKFNAEKTSETVAGYFDKINVKVRHTFAGTPNPASWPVVYSGLLKNMVVDSTVTPGVISSTLGTNITHVYYMEFQLDPTTGNTFQGASAVAKFVFDATQSTNPGWTE